MRLTFPELNMEKEVSCDCKTEELDMLVSNIKEKLTVKCRPHKQGRRSAPYYVPITSKARAIDYRHGARNNLLPSKCANCFSRNCFGSKFSKCLRDQEDDSVKLLKKLLNDQTLIQEAVKRLHSPKPKENRPPRTRHNSENVSNEEFVQHSYESAEESESDYDM